MMTKKTVGKKKALEKDSDRKLSDLPDSTDRAKYAAIIRENQAEIMRLNLRLSTKSSVASTSTLRATLAAACRCLAEEME